jgi:hypothetical protein
VGKIGQTTEAILKLLEREPQRAARDRNLAHIESEPS